MSLGNLPSWDLSQLYKSYDDPQIELDFQKSETVIQEFVGKYKGKVNQLSATELFRALNQVEEILGILTKPSYYFELAYEAGGINLDQVEKASQIASEKTANLSNQIIFFDLELAQRQDLDQLSNTKELSDYGYYLTRLALESKHLLSEEAEQILNLKAMSGMEAWAKFYTDQKSKIEIESDFENPGITKKYRASDLSDKLYGNNREIRQKAWALLTAQYAKNEEVVLEAYNNILLDKKIDDQLRGYSSAEESKLIENQLTSEVLASLINSIQNHTHLIQRYYTLKKEILNLPKLEIYDMWSEIHFPDVPDREYSWDESKRLILDALGEFSPLFAEIAESSFNNF